MSESARCLPCLCNGWLPEGVSRRRDSRASPTRSPSAPEGRQLNVLLALADGERHGYGIMLEVRGRTGGRVRLGPGMLYGAIKCLKEGGLIEESEKRPGPAANDERRCYYRLTGFGGEVLAAEVERLDGLVRTARRKGVFPAPQPSLEGA